MDDCSFDYSRKKNFLSMISINHHQKNRKKVIKSSIVREMKLS